MREAMGCREVRDDLEAYAMGELDSALEDRFAVHLMGCTACAAEAGLAHRVEAELSELPLFDAPPDLIARIKAQAREESPARVASLAGHRSRKGGPLRPVVLTAALAAMLLAALGLSLWRGNGARATPTAEEVAQAEQEARYALALVARLGRKASTEVRDEVFVERVLAPVERSLGRGQMGRSSKSGGLGT